MTVYAGKTKAWVKSGLARLLLAHPEAGLRLAGSIGRRFASFPALKAGPSVQEVAGLFPDLPRSTLAQICREVGALERLNEALFVLLSSQGIEPLVRLVRVDGEDRLLSLRRQGVPVILADWHLGVILAPIAALIKLRVPAISLGLDDPFPPTHPLPESMRFITGEGERVSFLMQSLDYLRKGGTAVMGVNASMGDAFLEVPFLGRRVRVGRGTPALARLSGATIVPTTPTWAGDGRHIDLKIHDPLPQPSVPKKQRDAYEEAIMVSVARWFEDYVRSHPEQLRYKWLRDYLAAEPYAESSETRAAPSSTDDAKKVP